MADFPPTAIELIARHLATLDGQGEGAEPDPRRCVLPLISRSWRRALQLMPDLWGEMSIRTCDLWPDAGDREPGSPAGIGSGGLGPGLGTCAALGRMQAWFAERHGLVRRLSIRLQCGEASCNLSELAGALVAVLLSCASSLESLQLEVRGAPLLACSIFPRLAAAAGGRPCLPLPRLQTLAMCLDGSALCSQATNALHAEHALQAVALHKGLQRLSVVMRGIRAARLPPDLCCLPCLRSLELRYDPRQMSRLAPPAPRVPPILPATLTRLAFGDPPLRDDSAVALAADLPLLQAFQLSRWWM